MTFASESASMIRAVIVVLPEPVPPQMPMISGRLSRGRMAFCLLSVNVARELFGARISSRFSSPQLQLEPRQGAQPGHEMAKH
jgi:hypothetical protein